MEQPPSCGCVLKLIKDCFMIDKMKAAAFVRLCVETVIIHESLILLKRSRLRAAVC